MSKKVFLNTSSRQFNEHDAGRIVDVLNAMPGDEPADTVDEAVLMCFNTCSCQCKLSLTAI